MKTILAAAAVCLLCGCRMYSYTRREPDGTTIRSRVIVCLSNTKIESFRVTFVTNRAEFRLTGGHFDVDDEAVKAVSEGVTKAVLKAIKP